MANQDLALITECLRALQDEGDANALRRALGAISDGEQVPMPEFLSHSGDVPAVGATVLRMRVHGPDWESQIAAMRAAQADRECAILPAQPQDAPTEEQRVRLLEVD